jgi:23S rRNA pseudouridine2605 synthase
MKERLQKIMAAAGIDSRRNCETLIEKGKVILNGEIATIGQSADINVDQIEVKGKLIKPKKKLYFMLYKPPGFITAVKDEYTDKHIKALLPTHYQEEHIYPVGRLDKDAEGLLLLTNDGEFANKVAHPRYKIKKTYRAWLDTKISKEHVKELQKGVKLNDGFVKDIKINTVSNKCVDLTIHVGKHKVVKRILQHVGYRVKRLQRTQIGNIKLGNLKLGKLRALPETIVNQLEKQMEEKKNVKHRSNRSNSTNRVRPSNAVVRKNSPKTVAKTRKPQTKRFKARR